MEEIAIKNNTLRYKGEHGRARSAMVRKEKRGGSNRNERAVGERRMDRKKQREREACESGEPREEERQK